MSIAETAKLFSLLGNPVHHPTLHLCSPPYFLSMLTTPFDCTYHATLHLCSSPFEHAGGRKHTDQSVATPATQQASSRQ